MIVVDTNLLAYLLLATPHAAQADAVLLKDPDWIAPALIHSEFRNVLLGAVRRKDIEADVARVLLDRAMEVITVPDGGVDGKAVLSLQVKCAPYKTIGYVRTNRRRMGLIVAQRKGPTGGESIAEPLWVPVTAGLREGGHDYVGDHAA